MRNFVNIGLLGLSVSSLALASCADDTRYVRVASVGTAAPSDNSGGNNGGNNGGNTGGNNGGNTGGGNGNGGGSGSGSGSTINNILVAGGNVLVGAASHYASLTTVINGSVPAAGTVNGIVTAVLRDSGHTLVRLGNGTSVLLNGTGGGLGDLVSINLGSGTVVGAPTSSASLIGVNVLAANPTTGQLATVSAASGNKLVGVTVLNSALGTGGTNAGNNNNIVISPAIAPVLGINATTTVTNTVNATVSNVTNGLIGGGTGH